MFVRSIRFLALGGATAAVVFASLAQSGAQAQTNYTSGLAVDMLVSQDGPATVARGSVFTYNVLVSNLGPGVANGVSVSDTVAPGFVFEPSASDPRCSLSGRQVVCLLGDFRTSAPVTIRISFRTPIFDACVDTTAVHVVSVSSYEQDTNLGNNKSQPVTTTIKCGPPATQCSDGRDNDVDGFVDQSDPGCHSDFNAANLSSYRPQSDDETLDQQDSARRIEEQRQRQRLEIRRRGSVGRITVPPPPPPPPAPPVVIPVRVAPRRPVVRTRPARDVAVSFVGSQTEAMVGDSIVYTLNVRNLSDRELRGLQVVVSYPESNFTVVDAGAGTVGNSITWMLSTLQPGQSRTLSYSLRVNPGTQPGDTLSQTVRVTGGTNVPTAFASLAILQPLPQTGISTFTGELENTARFLRPLGGVSAGWTLVVIAVACAAATGGMTLAKKRSEDTL